MEKNDPVLKSLEGFSVKEVNVNIINKSVSVLLKPEGSDKKALVHLEKTPFCIERVISYLSRNTNWKETLKNDFFCTYESYIPSEDNAVNVTVIYPATGFYIKKYMGHDQERFVIEETADLYKSITLPLIQKKGDDNLKWMYNILEKEQESERIVFEDPDPETGFTLLPDMKWDEKNNDTLHLLAIVHKRGIKSLRDLNGTHLPLLRNILKKGL